MQCSEQLLIHLSQQRISVLRCLQVNIEISFHPRLLEQGEHRKHPGTASCPSCNNTASAIRSRRSCLRYTQHFHGGAGQIIWQHIHFAGQILLNKIEKTEEFTSNPAQQPVLERGDIFMLSVEPLQTLVIRSTLNGAPN
jgi:hypothetical protein